MDNIEFEPDCKSRGMETGLHSRGEASVALEREFTRMVKEHRKTIYTVCYFFSKDTDEVNDLFQEIVPYQGTVEINVKRLIYSTMAHNDALMELESLREQYGYINEKLNKQSLINEKMMSETIRTKINRTEQWYRQRFLIYALCPVGMVGFVNMGFHWGFTALFVAICIAQFLLDRKCYQTLNPKELAALPVTKASENVAQHRYWRSIADKAMNIPLIILAGWTVMIAAGYTLNLSIISITAFVIALGIIWGVKQQKTNMKKLDEAMEAIRDLKG